MTSSGRCARKNGPPKSLDELSYLKSSVIQIENDDTSCGFRAIAVGLHYYLKILMNARPNPEGSELNDDILDELRSYNRLTRQSFSTIKEINQKWQNMRKSNYKLQKEAADGIRSKAGIPEHEPLRLSNIQRVEGSPEGFRIIVVNRSTKKREYPIQLEDVPSKCVFFEYIPPCPEYEHGHYHCIANIVGYMESRTFCVKCGVGTKKKDKACVRSKLLLPVPRKPRNGCNRQSSSMPILQCSISQYPLLRNSPEKQKMS